MQRSQLRHSDCNLQQSFCEHPLCWWCKESIREDHWNTPAMPGRQICIVMGSSQDWVYVTPRASSHLPFPYSNLHSACRTSMANGSSLPSNPLHLFPPSPYHARKHSKEERTWEGQVRPQDNGKRPPTLSPVFATFHARFLGYFQTKWRVSPLSTWGLVHYPRISFLKLHATYIVR